MENATSHCADMELAEEPAPHPSGRRTRQGAGVVVRDRPEWEPLVSRVCEMVRDGLLMAPSGPEGPLPVPREVYERLRPNRPGTRLVIFASDEQHAVFLPDAPGRRACLVPFFGERLARADTLPEWSLDTFRRRLAEEETLAAQVEAGLLSAEALAHPERVDARRRRSRAVRVRAARVNAALGEPRASNGRRAREEEPGAPSPKRRRSRSPPAPTSGPDRSPYS